MATTPTPISSASPLSSRSPSFLVKCSKPINININGVIDTKSSKLSNNGGGLKNVPSGIIDELLNRDQNRVLVDELDKTTTAMMEEAEHGETERKTVNNNKEKLESIKAASISAIVGTLASLPISLTHYTNPYELTVSTAITIITCALYGATYRYTIRRDLNDFHLKTGTSAAFGIVKGVATLDGQPSLDAFSGAVCVSENVLVFLFAAAGLDICYKMGLLSPFPLERSDSRTKCNK